jgi:hypothetical protein
MTERLPIRFSLVLALVCCATQAFLAVNADSFARFERTYTPTGTARLTLSNINGTIHVAAWDKRTITVRANIAPSVVITDQVYDDDITITVKRDLRLGRADFEVSLPPETTLTLKNVMGDIEVRDLTGHLNVNTIDSNVRLLGVNSPSVDVKVTTGDIFFDGALHEAGTYNLQSIKGDIDVTVPESTSFNLNARALSENISLGSFLSNLSGASRGPKGITGSYLKGGPRLILTAYAGKILMHKK